MAERKRGRPPKPKVAGAVPKYTVDTTAWRTRVLMVIHEDGTVSVTVSRDGHSKSFHVVTP
jgi:hypothetical protein